MDKLLIGIDVGGTNIKSVIMDESYTIITQDMLETKDTALNPGLWKESVYQLIEKNLVEYKNKEIKCGIAAPGLTDKENTMISYMPVRMQGIEGFDWGEFLQLPTTVINDAKAACLSEWKLGAAKGKQHVLLLTLGTGVGGGAILDGKLFQGTLTRATHFGHISVNYTGKTTSTEMVGSLEYAIGDYYILERTKGQYSSTADLVRDYKLHDTKASYWWLDSVNKLAVGICSLINAFAPEIMVIGGGIAEAEEALFKPLNDFISLYEWSPGGFKTPIVKAEMGSYSGAIGAAIFSHLKQNLT